MNSSKIFSQSFMLKFFFTRIKKSLKSSDQFLTNFRLVLFHPTSSRTLFFCLSISSVLFVFDSRTWSFRILWPPRCAHCSRVCSRETWRRDWDARDEGKWKRHWDVRDKGKANAIIFHMQVLVLSEMTTFCFTLKTLSYCTISVDMCWSLGL